MGGINKEPILYIIKPSGDLNRWKAKAAGRGEKEAQDYLKKNYKDGMNEENAKKLAVAAMEAGENKFGKFDKKAIEFQVIRKE